MDLTMKDKMSKVMSEELLGKTSGAMSHLAEVMMVPRRGIKEEWDTWDDIEDMVLESIVKKAMLLSVDDEVIIKLKEKAKRDMVIMMAEKYDGKMINIRERISAMMTEEKLQAMAFDTMIKMCGSLMKEIIMEGWEKEN